MDEKLKDLMDEKLKDLMGEKLKELMENATKKLIDEGLIVEAGWVGFKAVVISPHANEIQLHDMRGAFFAGAMHLFSSIIVSLDEEHEPTEDNLKRMDLIHKELERYMKTMQERMQ